jgi:anti-sigma factor RsiW
MRDCTPYQEDLRAYLDGELPPARRMAVRLHLARCAACREEINTMEQIGNDLRAGDAASLDPGLRAKILAGLDEAAPASSEIPAEPKPVPKWRRRPVMIWGTAAALVITWFALYPLWNRQGAPPMYRMMAHPKANIASVPTASEPQSSLQHQDIADAKSPAGSNAFQDGHAVPPAATATAAPGTIAKRASMAQSMDMEQAQREHMEHMPPYLPKGFPVPPASPSSAAASSVTGGYSEGALVSTERQVRKQADITVEVEKLEEKSDTVEQMVQAIGGFVANNQLSTGEDGLKTASLETRIPVTEFESFLAKVAKLGEVKAKNVTGEDITEQVSDQNQTLRVLSDDIHMTEAKLRDRRGGALNAEDQEQLRQSRVRVAQAQARLEMLKKLAALSTITVQLREKAKVAPQSGFMDDMRDTGHAAVVSFLQAARLPVLVLIWLLAYAPIWILLAIAYRYAIRT